MNLDSQVKKVSYSLGASVAQSLKNQGFGELDLDIFISGLKDLFENKELLIGAEEGNKVLQEYVTEINAKKSASAKADGEKFLEENKKRETVKVTESGLQYEIIEQGSGDSPKATDNVTVHYEGRFIDGGIFDSSFQRNEPATFPVNGVIPGWTEALQLMNPGAKWRLFIPQDLAYGANGAGDAIPPYSTLVFDVELIKVN